VLHECNRLQKHLTAQDRVIVKICGYIKDHAPENHPLQAEMKSLPESRGPALPPSALPG